MAQMQTEENKPGDLMVYRISRNALYSMPFIFIMLLFNVSKEIIWRRAPGYWYWIDVAIFLLLLGSGIIWLNRWWVIDFRCTDEGIEAACLFRGTKKIAWSSLQRFGLTPSTSFNPGTCLIIAEGHPTYRISDMNPSQMDCLEELVHTYSNAEVGQLRKR